MDEFLTPLLRVFMSTARTFLDQGGREDALDRIARTVGTTVAVLLILWTPQEKPSAFGMLMAIGRRFWRYRRWIF